MEDNLWGRHPAAYELLCNLNFCVIDLETTGGDHRYDKIIEIGLVKIQQLKMTDQFSFLIRPEVPIPEFVQRLTSIHEKDVANAPTIENLIDQITELIGDSILVAHNASFDIPFLNSILKRLEKPLLKNPSLCTNLMTKYLIPELMNSNLPYVGELFGIEHKNAHRALEDARVTAKLLISYLNFFIEKDIKKVNHLYYPRRKYELNTAHFEKGPAVEQQIQEQLSNVKTALLMMVKSSDGLVTAVLPMANPQKELKAGLAMLQNDDWGTVTFKLIGNLTEAVFTLGEYFGRLPENTRKFHLDHLYHYNPPMAEETLKWDHHQFLVIPHLIPEQYRIYSLDSKGIRGQMIFRYPTHQKKLSLFLTHQMRPTRSRQQNAHLPEEIKHFISSYLNRGGPFLLFSADEATKTQELKKRLQRYIDGQKHFIGAESYPRFHIY